MSLFGKKPTTFFFVCPREEWIKWYERERYVLKYERNFILVTVGSPYWFIM